MQNAKVTAIWNANCRNSHLMSNILNSLCTGSPVPSNHDYPISVASDACAKAYHFSNAGVKQAENIPLTFSKDSFVGAINGQVETMVEANAFQSPPMEAVRLERETMEAALAEDPCNVSLVAARHTAAAKGDLDRTGLAGLCWKHVFPLRDLCLHGNARAVQLLCCII